MAKYVHAGLACAVACALPSHAVASCWTRAAATAAELRGLETMLMVSALRCRLDGYDFLPDYNRFIRFNRATLAEANDALRRHFDRGDGWRGALERYDAYVTSVANRHGERGDYGCRELAMITQDAIDAEGDPRALLRLARAIGVELPPAARVCRGGGDWVAYEDEEERFATAAPAATPMTPMPAVAAVAAPIAAAPVADPALPTTVVADAPIAEPQPIDATAAHASIEGALMRPAVAVAQTAPASTPPVELASQTVVAPAAGGAAITGTGDLEIEVTEGPVTNGVRTKTYRIRLAN